MLVGVGAAVLCFWGLFFFICCICIFCFWFLLFWNVFFPLTIRCSVPSVAGPIARMNPVGRKNIGAPWGTLRQVSGDESPCWRLGVQDFCPQRRQRCWCTSLRDGRTSHHCLLWAGAEDRPRERHDDGRGEYNDSGGSAGYNTRVIAAGSKWLWALHVAWIGAASCVPPPTEGHLGEMVANLQVLPGGLQRALVVEPRTSWRFLVPTLLPRPWILLLGHSQETI